MLSKIWQAIVIATMVFSVAVWAKITIYMCGDSTMQDWNSGYYPKRGIGQDFSYFWNADFVNVVNMGKGGTYAMGYYQSFWPTVKSSLKSGDFVIIQFGINDRTYSNEADFVTATTAMAQEALDAGATPIIINPVRRSDYRCSVTTEKNAVCDGSMVPDSIYESYHGYPIRAREIAASLGVPLIDMDTLSRNYLLSVGQYYALHYVNMYLDAGEYSTYANGNSDNLHLQQNGATVFGRITTEQMRVHSDANVRALSKYLAPMYQLTVKVTPDGSDSATTISSYYPAGMPVTLKTTPKAGKTFIGWYDGKGNKCVNTESSVQSPYICTMTMGSASTQYTAVYSGGSAELYTGDGAALTTFPTGTPKVLDEAKQTDVVAVDTSVKYDKDIKSWFDAYAPDSGIGFSENNHLDFIGEGFFNFDNSLNSDAYYQMLFPAAGYVTMGIRYSFAGETDRELNVYLDHDYYVTFKPTGSFDVWDTAWVNVDLAAGVETLKMVSTTFDGGPNIDAFGFSLAGVQRILASGDTVYGAGEVDTSSTDSTDSTGVNDSTGISMAQMATAFRLSGNKVTLASAANVNVKIFDMNGRMVANRTLSLSKGTSDLPLDAWASRSGVYRIVVKCGNQTRIGNWALVR